MTRALLVDVSNHQGGIDWWTVAHSIAALGGASAGPVEGALIKASEGSGWQDEYFDANWTGAGDAGLARGAYHFARYDLGNPPELEAEWFWSVVGPRLREGDSLHWDVEEPNDGDLNAKVKASLRRLAELAGFAPLLYSRTGFMTAHNLTHDPELAEHGLWLAAYPGGIPSSFPVPPPLWPFTAIHQFTSKGRVSGISGDVDLNYFNGPIANFRLYGAPAAPAPPVPVTPPVTLDAEAQKQAKLLIQDIIDRATELNTLLHLPDWDQLP
jgi:lysozyme